LKQNKDKKPNPKRGLHSLLLLVDNTKLKKKDVACFEKRTHKMDM